MLWKWKIKDKTRALGNKKYDCGKFFNLIENWQCWVKFPKRRGNEQRETRERKERKLEDWSNI